MPTEVKDFTLEQLKAMAYDTLANIESLNKNLNIINQEIFKKSQELNKNPEIVKEVPQDAVKVEAEVKDVE